MKQAFSIPQSPEGQALREGLDKANFDYLIKADQIRSVTDIIEIPDFRDKTLTFKSSPLARAVGEARDRVTFLAHALVQAGDRDTPLGDDEAVIEAVLASRGRIADHNPEFREKMKSREYSAASYAGDVIDINLVLYRLRNTDGTRVRSPFGKDFARGVADGTIYLGQEIDL